MNFEGSKNQRDIKNNENIKIILFFAPWIFNLKPLFFKSSIFRGVAQPGLARFVRDEEVGSSNLPTPTMFFTYILFSLRKNKFYIGHTNDLKRRLFEHNSGQSPSTKSGIPWTLVYSKEFTSNSDAVKFEMKIKSMKSRKYIEDLINNK